MVRPELLQPLGDDVKQGLDLGVLAQERGEAFLQTVATRVRQAIRRRRRVRRAELCGHVGGARDDTAFGVECEVISS